MAGIRTGLVLLLASLTAVVFAHTALADPTAPLAHADAYSVTGSSITVDAPGVLGNDTFTAPATVALSGPGPAHGSLTLNPDGSFTYTPSVGFTGSDTFDYTVTDAVGFALAMVTLDVGPAVTPIAAAGDEYGGYRDTTLTIPASTGVLANDSGNGLLSATLVDNATHGSLLLNSDGSFAYNPDPGYTGNDSFTYTATDATPATSTPTTVTLQVHGPPTAVDDSYSTGSTSHLVVDFLGGVLINDDGLQPTAQLVSPTSHGQISLSSDGSFIYIPSGTYSGTDSFTYTISDGPFTSNTATATITVNAVAPANDNFAGAQPTGSDSGTYTGDSSFSTSEPADPYGLGKSVWFSYVPTASGQLEIDTCGTNFSNYVLVTDDAEQVLTYAYVSCSYGHLFLNVTGGTHYYFELASDTFQGGPYTINWTLHLPPSNDDAANATVLSGNSGSLDGSTARATADPTDPGYGYAMPSVWYAWTASRDGQLTVDDCGPNAGYYSEYLAVTDTSGVTLAGPQYIPCYYGALRVPVTAGQTYRIEVTGYYGNTNPFTVRWVFNAPPANDNFANAQVLSGASGSAAGTTTLATYEPTDVFFSPNVWFAYTAPSTGVAQFDTCGTGNTTVLAAYDTAHTNLVTQYGGCGAMPVPVTAGEEIRIMVASYYGNAFDFGLNYRFFGTPANDNPSTAQSLTGDTGSVTGDDTAATDSGSHYTSGGHDIFFLYNPSTDGTAIFSSRQSSFQSTLNVLDANGSGGWSSIATGDRIVTSVTAGRTYLVVLDGCCSNADGAYELDYDLGQPAASDNFAHREILPFDANGSLSGNNDYSTAEPFDITNGGQSNWYAYTPHQDGSLLLTANGSGFTPQIAVGEDDGSGGVTADGSSGNGRLVVPVLGGTTYYIAVDGSDSGGGCGECETATTQSSTLGGGITGDYTVDLSLSGPPANDHSAGAFDLGTSLSGNTSESNLGATGAGDEFTQNGSGVWFVLHPDAGTYGRLTLSTSSNTFFPQISAGHLGGSYATGFGSLQTIISGDTPIYIEIDGDPSQQGDFQLQWSFQALTPPSGAVRNLAFCNSNTLFRNDDGSTNLVELGFGLNFFGNTFSSLYVNNNGNVTFTRPQSTFTPFNVTAQTGFPIIAPYFADVDTRNDSSGMVHYGSGEIDGRQAFCVNWLDAGFGGNKGVGYYFGHADKLNTFQLLLINRNDRGAGDFDIEMNYDNMQWETGDASGGRNGFGGTPAEVAYTNGSGRSFLLPGSFQSGHLTDGGTDALVSHSLNSPDQLGRYLFQVANGEAPIGQNISGHVFFNDTGHPLRNALVQVCSDSGFCSLGNTGTDGSYSFSGVGNGNQRITAFPPAGTDAEAAHVDVLMAGSPFTNEDLILHGPVPPPPGEGLTPNRSNGAVVYWNDPLTLGAHGCTGGTATYDIDFSQSETGGPDMTGSMTESVDEPGFYTASIGTFYPRHGHIHITTTIVCPDDTVQAEDFDVYIDPSGTVVDQAGHTIAGATVTLERATSSSGPWSVVPNGSAIMSSDNRNNPDHTDSAGHFGWNVVTGWYRVTATSPGCTSATTDPVQIPPAVLDLVLTLTCPQATTTTLTSAPSSVLVTQLVGYEAQVSPPAGAPTPTGTVHFIQDGVEIGTALLDAHGIATLPWAYFTHGDKHVLAHYDGDAADLASDSNLVTTAVALDTATVHVSSDVNPSAFGQSVTFTAQIGASFGIPTGTVSFQVDGTAPVDVATVSDGTPGTARAQFTISSLTASTHAINVQYNGDSVHSTATDSMTQTVNLDPTTTTVTSSLDPSVFGDSVSFTAHVGSTHGTTPVGLLVFTVDGTPVGSGGFVLDGHGDASFSTSALAVGDHTVAAFFDSTAGYAASTGSVTQTVTRHPSGTALSSSHNPSSYGDSVTFSVDVTGPSSGTVVLAVDGTVHPLALAGGHAQYTTSSLDAGDHTVQARYGGDSTYLPSDAAPVTQTVNKADTALALSSSVNPSTVGQLVGFTAHVTSGGAPVTAGSVVFTDGASPLASVPLDAAGNAVAPVTFSTTGTHGIQASYAGAANYNGSSNALDQSVARATSSTIASATPGSTTYGNLVTLSASVTGVSPTGSVTFSDGAAPLGTVPLAGGVSTLNSATLRPGDHPITAAYSGDAANAPSSGTTAVHIDKVSSAVHVFSGHNPSALGELVGFTIAVSYAGPDPAGTVQVVVDGAAPVSLPLDATGNALYSAAFTTAGAHTVAASYGGNALNLGSTSATLTQNVAKATPSTTLGAGPDPTPFGQAVPLTATVSGGYFPTGSVTFKEGTTTIATVPLSAGGTASASVTGLAAGSHTFTAAYSGDGNNDAGAAATVSHTVSPAATTTGVTSTTNPSVFGGAVTFTVTVASAAGTPGGSVALTDGTTTLATLTLSGGSASFSTAGLAVGTHAIKASYAGATNYAASSGTVSQTVKQAASTTTVVSALNPAVAGQSVTFSIDVSGPGGIPSGTVTLLDGTTTLTTLTLSTAGQASYATSTLTGGSHPLTAHYNGDTTYLASTSAPLTQVITSATTKKASLLMYLGPILTGDRTPTMLARLSDAGNLLISLTGRPITFSIDGGAPQSTTSTILGLASITVNHTLSYGTHTVVIRFAGDSAYTATSTSATFVVTRAEHGDRD